MSAGALIEGLPDLVVLIRRDGVVLECTGGHAVPALRPATAGAGEPLEALWPAALTTLVQLLTRRALAQRQMAEARLEEGGRTYEIRVSPQGPERALCIIRAASPEAREDSLDATDERPRPQLDRRGFLKRCKESLSNAALREQPLAVAVIQVEGISDIAQVIATKLAEQLMSAAILRLPTHSAASAAKSWWYLGQLSDQLLALVLESSDRAALSACVTELCASLRQPLAAGGAEFHLTPYAGVAILGQDASTPKLLLDHARAAANEARRRGSREVCFFTDTLRLESLARLDIAREMREAIAARHIRMRYTGRYELASGRLVAWVGYLRWLHPLRGEIRPAEFLRVAETTGLATLLSRSVLASLRDDLPALTADTDADVRVSFGALRHHVLHDEFAADIGRLLAEGALPAERLELRIAERALITRDSPDLADIARRGVRLVVDEVARGMGSLDLLARAPLWGLQLDRAWVSGLCTDALARKVSRAGIGIAHALGLTPLAVGVDHSEQRDALMALGCRYGSGDLFTGESADIKLARAI
jgi:EAL domain-containing protein (putative c-di-GMP-specific phosphodiesterase class I)/GGDEF domain-containing protein